MRLAEVEAWALRIIDGVRSGVRQEDTRVELKVEWIADRQKVARQLAGSCNAARGSEVLWLFGVDEVRGVLGCAPEDFASWWQGVTAEFAGVAPKPTEVVVHDGGLTFMAVLFSTVRSPFLIKNPQHGTRGGGPIQREVPWREGTSTRTATREDLLRLLDPSMPTPHVEVVRGRMTVRANNQPDAAGERQGYHWFLDLTSYVTSPVGVAVVLPEHRCQGQITFEGFDLTMDTTPKLSPTGRSDGRLMGSGRSEPVEASLIQRGDAQVVVMGPGFLSLTAHIYQSFPGPPPNLALLDSANVRMALRPAGSDRSIAIGVALDRVPTQLNPRDDQLGRWIYQERTPSLL